MDLGFEQYLLHGQPLVASRSLSTLLADLLAVASLEQFATLICVFTLDRIGRRWTLYWGSVMQGISMFLCGGFTRLGLNADAAGDVAAAGRYGIAAASMIFIFTFTFGATWLTVPWLYPAEIFPLAVRAKGNAWGVVGWSIGNGWLVSAVAPDFSTQTTRSVRLCFADPAPAGMLCEHCREDILPLRYRQRAVNPDCVGVVPRDQSADARRSRPAVHGRHALELGRREDVCADEARDARRGARRARLGLGNRPGAGRRQGNQAVGGEPVVLVMQAMHLSGIPHAQHRAKTREGEVLNLAEKHHETLTKAANGIGHVR